MIKIQIKEFVTQLFGKHDTRINLSEEVVKFLQEDGMSDLEALEKSDELIKRIKRTINKKIKECKHQGITPQYLFDESNDDVLIRTDLVVSIHEEKDVHRILEWKDPISEFLKTISWQEFEKICGLILEINDIQDCNVTRGSKDGGVDVYGWLKYHNTKRIFHDINIRVVGQGKHRSNGGEVTNADISEFVTDIDKLRKKQGFSLFVLTDEFVESPFPLIPILITNGYYRGDTINTAANYGIIIWNGEQISEDIARYFDLTDFVSNRKIDKEKFRNYLNR